MISDLHSCYMSQTSHAHRQRLGQFLTPDCVAHFMAAWALANGAEELYDPAFGAGAFYLAARTITPHVRFAGSEIDPRILEFFHARIPAPDLSLSLEDYLAQWGIRRTAIVCNPPYMRFQRFPGRSRVLKAFKEHLAVSVSGYTNVASLFLMKSISELVDGGRLAYIMPLEFLNTGYGRVVKEQMLASGRIHALIRIDCEKDAFPDVTTTVGIILFEKAGRPAVTRFYVVGGLRDLERLDARGPASSIAQLQLRPGDRWLQYFEPQRLQVTANDVIALSYYGAFSRGIATGANEFFVLRPSQVGSIGLRTSEVLECITKSALVKRPVFTVSDCRELLSRDAPVLLLNVNARPSSEAAEYLRQGEGQGFNMRYLTRTRSPWYRLEFREVAPVWFGVFSRDGYKVVRNYSRALNLTCFHGFRPNLFGGEFVDHLFLYLISAAGRKILGRNMRTYGNSLDKFEPNDLNQALVPSPDWFLRIAQERASNEMETVRARGALSWQMEEVFGALMQPDRVGPERE